MHFSLGLSDVTNPIVRETTSQDRIAAGQSCNVTHVDNYVTYSPGSDTSGFNKTWDSGLPVQFGSISLFATPTRYQVWPARTDSSPLHLTPSSPSWNETTRPQPRQAIARPMRSSSARPVTV